MRTDNGDATEDNIRDQLWTRTNSGQFRVIEVPAPTPKGNPLLWKIGGPLIGALVMGCAAILWDGLRENITEGKADTVAVDQLKADNSADHTEIKASIVEIKTDQQESKRLLKRVARKLKVDGE